MKNKFLFTWVKLLLNLVLINSSAFNLFYSLFAPREAAAQATIKGPWCGPGTKATPQARAATPQASP